MGQYDKTLGVLLVGIFVNTYLYGLVTFQFASYYGKKFNDPLWIKASVVALFVIDTFHSASVVYMAWEYCVTNFTNPAILGVALWPYTFTPIGTAMAALITHLFLGLRIYRMMKNKYVSGILLVLALASFATGVACGTKAWIIKDASKLGVLTTLVTCWLALQSIIDIMIASLITFILVKARTGYRQTNTVINRLIRGAIQTGFFAAVFALGDLFSFAISPNTNFYGMFAIPIGRIYTNTLMDTLNMREELKDILAETVELAVSKDTWDNRRSQNANLRFDESQTTNTDSSNDRDLDRKAAHTKSTFSDVVFAQTTRLSNEESNV
ncbi:hypothetical protein BDQ12DRAFT_656863 [Crucibulum laeve]|uniref:DUF6534 domain-containing protein n=1 Tax=Crucibulum laeve TaxID=68775 RepID=A0A5C3LR43_9AGAR|nr:hypothetical protein BDQ12DRAFT_656863 [Crucibulum laeve]